MTSVSKVGGTKSSVWCVAAFFFLVVLSIGGVALYSLTFAVSSIDTRLDTIGSRIAALEGSLTSANATLTATNVDDMTNVAPSHVMLLATLTLFVIMCWIGVAVKQYKKLVTFVAVPSNLQCRFYGLILEQLLPNVHVTVTPRTTISPTTADGNTVPNATLNAVAPNDQHSPLDKKPLADNAMPVLPGCANPSSIYKNEILGLLVECGSALSSKMPKRETIINLLIKYLAGDDLGPTMESLLALVMSKSQGRIPIIRLRARFNPLAQE